MTVGSMASNYVGDSSLLGRSSGRVVFRGVQDVNEHGVRVFTASGPVRHDGGACGLFEEFDVMVHTGLSDEMLLD